MKSPSKESIARACLIAYFLLLLTSLLVLGDRGEWLITIGFALIPPIMLGNQKQRLLTCVFVAFTLVVAITHSHNVRDTGFARLRGRLIQCEKELADLKGKQENMNHNPAIDTDE